MADLTTVIDAFTTARADTAAVAAGTQLVDSYGTCSVSGGKLNVQCGTSYGTGALTASTYSWAGAGFYFQTTPAPDTGGSETTTLYLIADGTSTDGSIRAQLHVNSLTRVITCHLYNVDGTYTDVTTPVSEPLDHTHAWLGWRYDSGQVRWVKSVDGVVWKTIRAETAPTWLTTGTQLFFGCQTNRVGGANTNALIDAINTGGQAPGALLGAPLLPVELTGTDLEGAVLAVRIAPGADLGAASTTWDFTDVTADVMFRDPVTIGRGRGDEQSQAQPSTLSLTLLNDSGDYTPRRPDSPYYPDMRLGFPIQVQIQSTFTGTVTVFTGFVDELAPSWDIALSVPVVRVAGRGLIQRLQQGEQPLRSTVETAANDLVLLPTVAAYWPCTDGAHSTQLASGLPDGAPMSVTGGSMSYGSYDGFGGSADLATFNTGANISGAVDPAVDTTGAVYFRTLLYAASALVDDVVMLKLTTTGTVLNWHLQYHTGGALSLHGYDAASVQQYDSGAVAFDIDGLPFYLSIELVQNAADIDVLLSTTRLLADGSTDATLITDTITTDTVGACTRVDMGANGTMDGWAVGHVGVSNDQDWLFASADLLTGYTGETATDRITRLCGEHDVPIAISGSSTAAMGSQGTGTLVDALRAAEATDHGVLFDGFGFGLAYVSKAYRFNRAVALALALTDLVPPFAPIENTSKVHNDVTAKRVNGSSARSVQPEGQPYAVTGPGGIGTYATSVQVTTATDLVLPGHASWVRALACQDLDRYPSLSLDFAARPDLAADWLEAGAISARITVTGLPDTAGPDPDLFVEGSSTTISPQEWTVQLNTSPAAGYDVAILDTDRLDTAASSLAAGAAAGATTLSVTTGNLWSTTAGTITLDVGGYPVTCTAIAGASSPQTFTVTGATVTDPLPAGAAVKLRHPAIVALGG